VEGPPSHDPKIQAAGPVAPLDLAAAAVVRAGMVEVDAATAPAEAAVSAPEEGASGADGNGG
jgi:hypothetical protein